MAVRVPQSLHRVVIVGVLVWAAACLSACTGNESGGFEASQVASATLPPSIGSGNPTDLGTDSNSLAPIGGTSGNPCTTLAVLRPQLVPTAGLGINLVPSIALGACLDLSYSNTASGTPLDLATCNGVTQAQSWQYVGGQLQIDGAWCLDVSSSDPTHATHAILNQCNSAVTRPGQFWNLVHGMLQIADTSICLTLPDASATLQKNLLVAACDPNNFLQQWAVDNNGAGGSIGVSISNQASTGACLGVDPSLVTAQVGIDEAPTAAPLGTSALITSCNGAPTQQWVWQSMALQAMSQCLQAGSDGATMQACDATNPMQQWVTDRGRLKLFNSERCLDLATPQTGTGALLTMSTCSLAPTQQWLWGAPTP